MNKILVILWFIILETISLIAYSKKILFIGLGMYLLNYKYIPLLIKEGVQKSTTYDISFLLIIFIFFTFSFRMRRHFIDNNLTGMLAVKKIFSYFSMILILASFFVSDAITKFYVVLSGITYLALEMTVLQIISNSILQKLKRVANTITKTERDFLLEGKIVNFFEGELKAKWHSIIYDNTQDIWKSGCIKFSGPNFIFFQNALNRINECRNNLELLEKFNQKYYSPEVPDDQEIISGRHMLEKMCQDFQRDFGYRPSLKNFPRTASP